MAAAPGPSGRKRKYVWTGAESEAQPRPLPGLCGAVAALASSITTLAGWGTARLQLGRAAPERYDLRLSRPGGWGPLGVSLPTLAFLRGSSLPPPTLLPGPLLCSQAHNPDGQQGPFYVACWTSRLFPISLSIASSRSSGPLPLLLWFCLFYSEAQTGLEVGVQPRLVLNL